MVPVRARLFDRELINEGRLWLDARKAHAGYPVHLERQDQAVPMERRVLVKCVLDCDPHSLSFLEADQGSWQHAVNRHGVPGADHYDHGAMGNHKMELVAVGGRL